MLRVDARKERSMAAKVKAGDRVAWDTSQGETKGKVVKKLTKTTKVKGYTAKASKAEPQFLVKSDKTGAKAAHKAKTLKKR
jgi:hypothetical protein